MKVVSPPVHRGRPPPADRVAIRLDAQPPARRKHRLCLSVLALQGFDRVFGCVVWAVQRIRTRLTGELDTAHPETLPWSREVAAVLYGLPAPPGIPGGHRSVRERMECKRGERRSSRAPVCCRVNVPCTASSASSSPASPSRLPSPAAERARCVPPRRRRRALETRDAQVEAPKSAGPEAARDSACPTRASSSGPISRGPGGGGHQPPAPRANPCLPSPPARRTSAQFRRPPTIMRDHENPSQLTEPVFDCKTLVH